MFWSTFLSLFGLGASAQESQLEKCADPQHPQQSILFIGNSFTYYDNMPLTFSKLAKERIPNRELKVYLQAAPGYKLWQHCRDKNTRPTLMDSGKWDFVVLQEQSEMALAPDTLKTMTESCRWLDLRIKQIQGRTVLFMTWCDLETPANQIPISRAYRDLARQLGAIVIPAGDLFLEVKQKDPSIALYDPDKHHPSHYGSFLVACLSEAILLHSKYELEEFVRHHRYQNDAHRDPTEQKLQEYADEFAIREKSQHP